MRRAGELKRMRAARPAAPAARRQDARHDLREGLDAHARSASRSACTSSAATRSTWPTQGIADRPRRAAARHRARAGRLLPRHRHPHLRARRRRGAGALRAGAGDQRAHRSVAPVPGAGRSVHRLGAARPGALEPGGARFAWIGDGNNMAHSWIEAAAILGLDLSLACPEGYDPDAGVLAARAQATATGAPTSTSCATPTRRRAAAACLSTDVWASMGEEGEAVGARSRPSPASRVDDALLQLAAPDVIVLHCLPAHRGEEITEASSKGRTRPSSSRPRIGCTCKRRSWNVCSRHGKSGKIVDGDREPSQGSGPTRWCRVLKPAALAGLKLGAEEGFVLSRVDGKLTVGADLPAGAVRRRGDRRPSCSSCARLGAVDIPGAVPPEPLPTPPPAPPRRRRRRRATPPSPPQVDGLELTAEQARRIDEFFADARRRATPSSSSRSTRTADKKDIKRAYFKLSKELHPDRFFGKNIGPYRERLSQHLPVGQGRLRAPERRRAPRRLPRERHR